MIYSATGKNIQLAKNILKKGDLIIYPTDTLYGFGVDATNTNAINKLNRIKGRVKPLSIIVESITQIKNFSSFREEVEVELNQIFPGPYTVLLKSIDSILSPLIQNGMQTIGIRIPNHFFPLQLVKLLGNPVVTTSINRHGNKPLIDVNQMEIDFPNIDIFEDTKQISSQGSTIIDYSISPPNLIRKGAGLYPL